MSINLSIIFVLIPVAIKIPNFLMPIFYRMQLAIDICCMIIGSPAFLLAKAVVHQVWFDGNTKRF